MIYVTGDLHGPLSLNKLSEEAFPAQATLTKSDYVIICGDFGLVWSNSEAELAYRDQLSNKPFTTLFIDGNHENFDLLYQFPLVDKFEGKVREIAPSIYHLERGQILNIDGHRIFAMGGAESTDRYLRKQGESWWPQEMPTNKEIDQAARLLDEHNWTVDYVITHCGPRDMIEYFYGYRETNALSSFFNCLYKWGTFKKWYFGHYHDDRELMKNLRCIYHDIIPLGA